MNLSLHLASKDIYISFKTLSLSLAHDDVQSKAEAYICRKTRSRTQDAYVMQALQTATTATTFPACGVGRDWRYVFDTSNLHASTSKCA